MSSSFFTKNQIKLNKIDSTNRFLLEFNKYSKISGPIVVTAEYQSEGRGRASKSWFSNRGENLLISLLLNHKLHINKKFDLSILISLAIIKITKKNNENSNYWIRNFWLRLIISFIKRAYN